MSNGELQNEVREILESGDVPQKVANRLIMAGVVENYKLSKKNGVALFGDEDTTGIVAEVRFWKRINWLIIALLIAQAVAVYK